MLGAASWSHPSAAAIRSRYRVDDLKGGNVAGSDVSSEVLASIEEMTAALNTGDADGLESLLSNRAGCIHIGSDPDEWWTKDELVTGIGEAMSVGGSQIRAEHGETTVHVLGEVAWTEGKGKFVDGEGRERGIRMTGVFVREDGRWKAAQVHASIGVANDRIFSS